MSDFHAAVCFLIAALALTMPSGAAQSAPAAVEPEHLTAANAVAVFAEFAAMCSDDGEKLWGVSLCGPMMLVEPGTHRIMTNRADTEGKLRADGDVFVGELPPDQPVANTATTWAGMEWLQILWPLPEDERRRRILLAHESFHHIQDQVAERASGLGNTHLDTLQGRYTLQLEWRALAAALGADNDAARRAHVADALLFRKVRYLKFPQARSAEFALERNEGLAEYTGVVIGTDSDAARVAAAMHDIDAHADDPSFMRSFAYATGPAYGLLLDRYNGDWRSQLHAGDGLAAMLAAALGLDFDKLAITGLNERAANYGGAALMVAEKARKAQRDRLLADYRAALVEGPVLVIPRQHMQVQFDPRTLIPLDCAGTVYPHLRVRDDWGSINVEDGALMTRHRDQLIVPAAGIHVDGSTVTGSGWLLRVADGWEVVPGVRAGDYTLRETTGDP